MADGIFHHHIVGFGAVIEEHLHRIADRALLRIEVILAELGVLHHVHFLAQRVDPRVLGHGVVVIGGGQAAKDHGHRHHVLDAVVAIGRIVQGPRLVDDAHPGFLGLDHDALDAIELVAHLGMQLHGCLHRRLGMELGREGDLEQHVFHHIAAKGLAVAQRIALEQHILEAPGLGGERGGIAHLAGGSHEGQPHAAGGGIAGRPALARTGVGRVAIGAQGRAVDPGVGDGVDDLLALQPQHLCGHGGGGDAHQHDVIQAHAVEAVVDGGDALDLVRLDHGDEHIAHQQRRLALGHVAPAQVIGKRQDAAQVIRRMAPFGGQPGVVVVQPANHAADVEGRLHRIEFIGRPRHPRPTRHDRARHQWSHQLGAGGEGQRQQAAAQGVHQAVASRLHGFLAFLDLGVENVVGHVDQDRVRLGALGGADVVSHEKILFQEI